MRGIIILSACVAFVAVANADLGGANKRESLVPMSASDNAGPKYDIDFSLMPEASDAKNQPVNKNNDDTDSRHYHRHTNNEAVEREAATPTHTHSHSQSHSSGASSDDDDKPTGTVHVRRIYIVPSMGPSAWSSNPFAISPLDSSSATRRSSLWSLLGESGPMDETYNSDVESVERKEATDNNGETVAAGSETKPTMASDDAAARPSMTSPDLMTDPHRLLMDMIQQALQTRLTTLKNYFEDMQPAASGDGKNSASSSTGVDSLSGTLKPGTHNETKEDIVEYDGVKYLRKTIITKNVGQNHMFFTKRFILTPLNETASAANTTNSSPTNVSSSEVSPAITPATPRAITTPEEGPSTKAPTMTNAASNPEVKVDAAAEDNSSSDGPKPSPTPVSSGASTNAPPSNVNGSPANREQLEKEDASTPVKNDNRERTSERLVRKKRAS